MEVATDPVFGLETVAAPYQGIALTQIRVEDALDNFFPPDTNVTPEIDSLDEFKYINYLLKNDKNQK